MILVGAMGSGKTTLGRRLAAALGRHYLDSDEHIAAETGHTAATIAAEQGVEALHQLELRVFLDMVASREPAVIAPAASVVEDQAARAALRAHRTVWLRVDPELVWDRLAPGDHRRTVDRDTNRRLDERRAPLFGQVAAAQVDTGAGSVDDTLAALLQILAAEDR